MVQKGTVTLKPFYFMHFSSRFDAHSLILKKYRETLMWPSCDLILTAKLLQEAAEMAKEALLSHFEWIAGNLRFKKQAPIARMPGGPGGVPHLATMSRCQVRCWMAAGCMRTACCLVNVASSLIPVLCP